MKDVTVVTPWYPSVGAPFVGSFVQAMVEATAPGCDRYRLLHCEAWVAGLSVTEDAAVKAAMHRLHPTAIPPMRTVGDVEFRHIPAPIRNFQGHVEIAQRLSDALGDFLGGKPIDSPVVHAHVGMPGGWAAMRNISDDTKLFVTEHASFLASVLESAQARDMYDELLHRCNGFFAVGEHVTEPLIEAFPHHADRIGSIANPISFDVTRPKPVTELRRWIYVGGQAAGKGVDILLEAFAICHNEDPALTLTFVGKGTLTEQLAERAAELGLRGIVKFTGAVDNATARARMQEHDLLVHPSKKETFGVTIVEALAAGMPVLVTRCGGPEHTLAGMEESAGEFIDIDDDPMVIVDGYRRLRARFPHGLDLDRARRELAAKFGYQAIADAHHRVWFGSDSNVKVGR